MSGRLTDHSLRWLAGATPVQGQPMTVPDPDRSHAGAVVLVVDDEEMVRGVARVILERAGFEVLQARDGVEAVEVFEAQAARVDLVLLDLTMPRMSGRRAFTELRARAAGLPIILSSGYAENETVTALLAEGLADFLPKPYVPSELLDRVHAALDQRAADGEREDGDGPAWSGDGEAVAS